MRYVLLLALVFGRTISLTIPKNDINSVSSGKLSGLKSEKPPLLYHRLAAADQSVSSSSGERKGRLEYELDRQYDDKDISDTQTPKNYAFSYAIKDRDSGDDFSHTEAQTGKATNGEYRVKLPDGRVQVVTYTADNNGYRANIQYEKGDFIDDNDNPSSSSSTTAVNPILKSVFEGVPTFIKDPVLGNLNAIRVNLSPTTTNNNNNNKQKTDDNRISGSMAGSYEITESGDELNVSDNPKLVSDVNYLLRYVKPTVDTSSNYLSRRNPTTTTTTSSYRQLNDFKPSPTISANPKYIHIHRYHPTKGEIVTSNLVTSKEIFDRDYNYPLQTDFDGKGSNFSDANFLPSNTFNSQPSSVSFQQQQQPSSNYLLNAFQPSSAPIADKFSPTYRSNFSNPIVENSAEFVRTSEYSGNPIRQQTEYSSSSSSIPYYGEPREISSSSLIEGNSFESEQDDNNNLIPLSDIEARKLSGYFDFVSEDEIDSSAERITSNSLNPSSSGEDSSNNNRGQGTGSVNDNSDESQRYALSPEMQYTEGEKDGIGLPHYYYEFSTATPTYRYVEPQFNSQAPPTPPTAATTDYSISPLNRSTSFNWSPFLRPLTRERVYIHHNSQPINFDYHLPSTNPSFNNELTTTKNPLARTDAVEVTIVKSLSSTIPPELIDQFDRQLTSSFSKLPPSLLSDDVNNFPPLPIVNNGFDASPPAHFPDDGLYKRRSTNSDRNRQQPSNVEQSLARKIQATLSTRGSIFVKGPSSAVVNNTVSSDR